MNVLQKRGKAQHLLDKVFDHLELVEKDYFGLQFADVAPAPDAMVSMSRRTPCMEGVCRPCWLGIVAWRYASSLDSPMFEE